MNYDNLTNKELLNEVYLTQHKDRLLTLVCERLEMAMREAEDYDRDRVENLEDETHELRDEIDRLNDQLADQDEEIAALNKKVDELETQLDAGEY